MISSVLGQVLLYSLIQLSSYLHVSALTLTPFISEDRYDTGKFPVTIVVAPLLEHTSNLLGTGPKRCSTREKHLYLGHKP